jgi:hypothetical protein
VRNLETRGLSGIDATSIFALGFSSHCDVCRVIARGQAFESSLFSNFEWRCELEALVDIQQTDIVARDDLHKLPLLCRGIPPDRLQKIKVMRVHDDGLHLSSLVRSNVGTHISLLPGFQVM